jgi:RecA-family ATPase
VKMDANSILLRDGEDGLRRHFDSRISKFVPVADERSEPDNLEPLDLIDPRTLAGRPVPPREWHARNLIPHRTVTLLTGDGGTGKSLLALQLSVATVLRKTWIGREVTGGRALYLSAEDDQDEVHRRLDDICAGEGGSLEDLGDLRILPLAGLDAVLAAPQGKSSIIAGTRLWQRLQNACETFRPRLVILDTSADLYAGEENNRAQVRQFIGMLRGLALRLDLTVVLLSHPSLTGISSGTGLSGSTAWNNSVRSRLYFRRVISQDGIEADPDLRILETMKSNYGQTGEQISVRWQMGRFVADILQSPDAYEQVTAAIRTDRLFLDLVQAYTAEGRPVSAAPSPNFAPSVFAKDPRANGTSKAALATAMNRLFEAGRIRVESYGPPSRRLSRLLINTDTPQPKRENDPSNALQTSS